MKYIYCAAPLARRNLTRRLTMRFEEMNWMDVEKYLQTDDRLTLVLGACEQHGYLSVATDTKIPLALADAVSKQTGIPVAPPLEFGVSPYFITYPGTISLRVSTYLAVVEDMVRSVYHYGFRRLLVLNGHGGNDGVRNKLVELANELPGLKFSWYSWWVSRSVEEVAAAHGLKPGHASWMEAFPFVRVADLPGESKNPPSVKGLLNAMETREAYEDGNFGGPYSADSAVMNDLFNAILADALYLADF
jgi:creatinine amidohydrolase